MKFLSPNGSEYSDCHGYLKRSDCSFIPMASTSTWPLPKCISSQIFNAFIHSRLSQPPPAPETFIFKHSCHPGHRIVPAAIFIRFSLSYKVFFFFFSFAPRATPLSLVHRFTFSLSSVSCVAGIRLPAELRRRRAHVHRQEPAQEHQVQVQGKRTPRAM